MTTASQLLRTARLFAVACAFLCSALLLSQSAAQHPATGSITGIGRPPTSGKQLLNHVELVLRWYRQWTGTDISVGRVGEELYIENGQTIARDAVKLEFQSALAQASLIGSASAKPAPPSPSLQGAIDAETLLQTSRSIGPQIQTLRTNLDAVNKKLINAPARQRKELLAQRDTLQGQLELALALQQNLQKLTSFMEVAENSSGAATELTTKILALQRTVPAIGVGAVQIPIEVAKPLASPRKLSTSQQAVQQHGNNADTGLIEQVGQLFRLTSSLRTIDQLTDQTALVQRSTQALRAPLLAALRATLREGQLDIQAIPAVAANGSKQAVNSTSARQLRTPASGAPQQKTQTPSEGITSSSTEGSQSAVPMQLLVQRFRLLSEATLPLSKQMILLDQSQANLTQLENSIEREYAAILRAVIVRVAIILFSLGLIWLFSELWRRATFRYVRDARRRRQFLVLRRVVTGFCMGVVILLGFVSEFSSLATYAGLITAGIAVALQTVILSVAAYFFLVGRYGVRVGDRITVVYSGAIGVSGEVLDIGLVRFYMLELTGSGIDMQPTGRICVFPNSVLLQTTPLFKQIPGTEYAWRELALPLHPETDVELAERELLATVNGLYAEYRPVLEKQLASVENLLDVRMEVPTPYTRVRFSGTGLEAIVRYPIPLRQSAQLDDRVIMELMATLQKNQSIRLAVGAAPELRSAIKQ